MKRSTVSLAVILLLTASVASARIVTRAPANGPAMSMESLLVADDGTVITVRHTTPDDSGDKPVLEVVAIGATGSVLWTWDAQYGARVITLDQDRVIVATNLAGDGIPNNYPTKLAALSLASGEVVWEIELQGTVHDAKPGIGMLYVLVLSPNANQANSRGGGGGMPPATPPATGNGPYGPADCERALIAIGDDGDILWTLDLTE